MLFQSFLPSLLLNARANSTEMTKLRKKDGTIVFKKKPSTFRKDTITNIIEVAKELEGLTEEEKSGY